jgi:hypothetical protein
VSHLFSIMAAASLARRIAVRWSTAPTINENRPDLPSVSVDCGAAANVGADASTSPSRRLRCSFPPASTLSRPTLAAECALDQQSPKIVRANLHGDGGCRKVVRIEVVDRYCYSQD